MILSVVSREPLIFRCVGKSWIYLAVPEDLFDTCFRGKSELM